jgi:lysozyme
MTIKMQLTTLSPNAQAICLKNIKQNERYEQYAYNDENDQPIQFTITGNPTIGYGKNLRDGLDLNEAELLTTYKMCQVESELIAARDFFVALSPYAKIALIDMAYNLGVEGLLGLDNFIKLLSENAISAAVDDLRATKWAKQVGARAQRDIALLETPA